MMCLSRQSTALTGFEIHHVATLPGHITITMLTQHLLAALAQQREGYAKTTIRSFGSRNRLEKQVHWYFSFQGCQLSCDVCQAAGLSRDLVRLSQTVKGG